MRTRIEFLLAPSTTWAITADPARLVALPPPAPPPAGSPGELARAALEAPVGFEPMRRALTPDDHVAVVVDPAPPHVADLLTAVLEHLASAGIDPAAVTLVTPPGADQSFIDALPDEYADVHVEGHDPADRKQLAYLATTKAGRRVYLNRVVVEAEFVVVLAGRRYTPAGDPGGAQAAIFPALSDAESAEVAWLLGMPFLVQVIEGANGTIQEIVAGLPDSSAEGARRQAARWKWTIPEPADTVFAVVPAGATFAELATAAATAAAAVEDGGRIVLLTAGVPDLGHAAEFFAERDDPAAAAKALAKYKPPGWQPAHAWATAARKARLVVGGGPIDERADDLFAVPVASESEAQRLADAAGRLLIIPDAHLARVEVG